MSFRYSLNLIAQKKITINGLPFQINVLSVFQLRNFIIIVYWCNNEI